MTLVNAMQCVFGYYSHYFWIDSTVYIKSLKNLFKDYCINNEIKSRISIKLVFFAICRQL